MTLPTLTPQALATSDAFANGTWRDPQGRHSHQLTIGPRQREGTGTP